jgi:hypothetical protein
MESPPLCDSYEARFAELPAVFAPVLLALNHELSMCSRLPWLIFPRSQATHLARLLGRTEFFQRFGRYRLMTLSMVYAIAP